MESMMSPCCENAFKDDEELYEVDGALLMELLEEPQLVEGEDDRLGCVIRSLEAELGPGHVNPAIVGGDGGIIELDPIDMEDMVLDFNGYGCSMHQAEENQQFDWVDMEVTDMGDWYVEDGLIGYGDFRSYPPFYYNGETSSIEQLYSPLWE